MTQAALAAFMRAVNAEEIEAEYVFQAAIVAVSLVFVAFAIQVKLTVPFTVVDASAGTAPKSTNANVPRDNRYLRIVFYVTD